VSFPVILLSFLTSRYSLIQGQVYIQIIINNSINFVAALDRTTPRIEIEAVSSFLLHLLTGDIEKLPTETLIHKFWSAFNYEHKQAIGYLMCLKKQNLTQVKCYMNGVRSHCGSRFGQKPPERLEQCRRLLANEINATAVGLVPNIARIFRDYRSCLQSYRRRVDESCTEILRKAIVDHRLRATKVVRATMYSMGPLLRALPTLRIVHLVRDPRAVAFSRNHVQAESSRGAYSAGIRQPQSRIVAEASLYCHHVIADIRSRLTLEREFPGRILALRYEDVVANPEQRFRDIYKFLGEPMPKAMFEEMQKRAKIGQSMNLATRWRNNLTDKDATIIAKHCTEFFSLLNISRVNISSHSDIKRNYGISSPPATARTRPHYNVNVNR